MDELYLRKLKELIIIDYILSDERERIINPIVDEDKLSLYNNVILRCKEYENGRNVKFDYDDPSFPKCIHMITIKFLTFNDEYEIIGKEMQLFNLIACADSVILDTDKIGNIRIDLFFENIYMERE